MLLRIESNGIVYGVKIHISVKSYQRKIQDIVYHTTTAFINLFF